LSKNRKSKNNTAMIKYTSIPTSLAAVQAEVKRAEKLIDKEKRAARLYAITAAYSMFAKMTLYAESVGHKTTYQEADFLANAYSALFGKSCTPSDFLHDSNEDANNAIDCYEAYKRILAAIDKPHGELELSSKVVDALCRSIWHGYAYRLEVFKNIGYIQYPELLKSCLSCIVGEISLSEFRRQFVWVNPSLRVEPVNLRQFSADMSTIEYAYAAIAKKQAQRAANKKAAAKVSRSVDIIAT
jgi:hypothetical protein